jgi:hypothetical protein
MENSNSLSEMLMYDLSPGTAESVCTRIHVIDFISVSKLPATKKVDNGTGQ